MKHMGSGVVLALALGPPTHHQSSGSRRRSVLTGPCGAVVRTRPRDLGNATATPQASVSSSVIGVNSSSCLQRGGKDRLLVKTSWGTGEAQSLVVTGHSLSSPPTYTSGMDGL